MKNLVIALALTLCAITAAAQGSRFHVNCDKGEKINKLLNTIAQAGAQPPIIINVNAAVTILNSSFVTLQGFLIQGGLDGVDCLQNSTCNLTGLTVENATGEGVRYGRSEGVLTGNVFQNNGFRGVNVLNGSKVVVFGGVSQGNADAGFGIVSGSELALQNVACQNNVGGGVICLLGSSVRLLDSTITGNGGDGITLIDQANGSLEQSSTGNVVTGNAGNGVFLRDLSFARFVNTNNVSGNLTQPDVTCVPQFPATRGAATAGGTTDCVEPAGAKTARDLNTR